VKFLPQEFAADHEAALGLLREAEAVALINHPNICTIYEIDHDGGASFIVMERLRGRESPGAPGTRKAADERNHRTLRCR
jgi:serine/threonine protein kinase